GGFPGGVRLAADRPARVRRRGGRRAGAEPAGLGRLALVRLRSLGILGGDVDLRRLAQALLEGLDPLANAAHHLGQPAGPELYEVLNRRPEVAAERAYAPWPDLEALLRARGLPLVSLESHLPLADFHVLGFSLQYELTYTNLLTMLELGRVPLRAAARGPAHPLVIAGGPCAFNP